MRHVEATPTVTIVIVEDEAAIAGALAARLRAGGFAVEVAADGLRRVVLRRKLGADVVRIVQGIGYAFGDPGGERSA